MSRLKIAGVAVALAALYGGWLLARDAPIFAVKKVVISGVHGAGSTAIRASLEDAARGMTTAHMQVPALRASVSGFPLVKDLRVRVTFPDQLRIQVIEEVPVAALVVAGQRFPVAADGKIVRGVGPAPDVTSVPIGQIPTGARITDPLSIDALELLDIAPRILRARVATVTSGAHGLTAVMRDGPPVYFGDTTRLHAKWAAVARVLADPASRGALYVDVHTPERPAAQVGDPVTRGPAASAPGTAAGALVTGQGGIGG
jgi:cell division septal protein FtsQ